MHKTTLKTLTFATMMLGALTATAGDGTQTNPFTLAEATAKATEVSASQPTGASFFVSANFAGFTSATTPATTPLASDSVFVLTDGTSNLACTSKVMTLGLTEVTNTNNVLVQGYYRYYDGAPKFMATAVYNAVTLTADARGYAGYHINSPIRIPNGNDAVIVCPNAGYNTTNGATVSYAKQWKADTVVALKNVAFILSGTANKAYEIVLTEENSSMGGLSSNLSGATMIGTETITPKNRYGYKFVSNETRVGFERDTTGTGMTLTFDRISEVYLKVNATFVTNYFKDGNIGFIALNASAIKKPEVTGIERLVQQPETIGRIYDLSGRYVGATSERSRLSRGLYIIDGRKTFVQ